MTLTALLLILLLTVVTLLVGGAVLLLWLVRPAWCAPMAASLAAMTLMATAVALLAATVRG